MLITASLVALTSTIITEILKLFPFLRTTDTRKRILTFIVCLVVSFYAAATSGEYTGDGINFVALISAALAMSYGLYKAVIQPLEQGLAKTLGKEVE